MAFLSDEDDDLSWIEIQELADSGDLESIRYCAASFARGDDSCQDTQKSRFYMELGYKKGDFWCGYQLAIRYLMHEDRVAGCELIKAIAIQGYSPALYKLGLCYFQGYGVEKNTERGFFYLEQAAAKGHLHAKASMLSEKRKKASNVSYLVILPVIKGV